MHAWSIATPPAVGVDSVDKFRPGKGIGSWSLRAAGISAEVLNEKHAQSGDKASRKVRFWLQLRYQHLLRRVKIHSRGQIPRRWLHGSLILGSRQFTGVFESVSIGNPDWISQNSTDVSKAKRYKS